MPVLMEPRVGLARISTRRPAGPEPLSVGSEPRCSLSVMVAAKLSRADATSRSTRPCAQHRRRHDLDQRGADRLIQEVDTLSLLPVAMMQLATKCSTTLPCARCLGFSQVSVSLTAHPYYSASGGPLRARSGSVGVGQGCRAGPAPTRHRADQVLRERARDALGLQGVGRVHELKVQIGGGRVAGVPNPPMTSPARTCCPVVTDTVPEPGARRARRPRLPP
jgi:hypothetical protein